MLVHIDLSLVKLLISDSLVVRCSHINNVNFLRKLVDLNPSNLVQTLVSIQPFLVDKPQSKQSVWRLGLLQLAWNGDSVVHKLIFIEY